MARIPNRTSNETKWMILEAFLSLYQAKELSKISVTEVCKKAGVNRSTFYTYFEDVYDLLTYLEDSFILLAREMYPKMLRGILEKKREDIQTFFTILEQYEELMNVLVAGDGSPRVREEIKKIAVSFLSEYLGSDVTRDATKMGAIEYLIGGQTATIIWWLQHKEDLAAEAFLQMMEGINHEGVVQLLNA